MLKKTYWRTGTVILRWDQAEKKRFPVGSEKVVKLDFDSIVCRVFVPIVIIPLNICAFWKSLLCMISWTNADCTNSSQTKIIICSGNQFIFPSVLRGKNVFLLLQIKMTGSWRVHYLLEWAHLVQATRQYAQQFYFETYPTERLKVTKEGERKGSKKSDLPAALHRQSRPM